MERIEANVVAKMFLIHLVSCFGVPLYFIIHRGRQFQSELFNKLLAVVGFHHFRTTMYHAQANSIIEESTIQ